MLMTEIEKRLKVKGCIRCYLLVVKDNIHAMHFYEKRGWEQLDEVYTYGKDLT
jgi:ribosomal protein S18 acetylase RimI-like enzyme